MDYVALRQQYRDLPALRELFDWISTHDIDENRMTVEELLEDGRLKRRPTIGALRELEELGCGHFKVGRKGHASRFEWSIDPTELAERLQSEEETPGAAMLADDDEPDEPVRRRPNNGAGSSHDEHEHELVRHVHRLRPNLAIEVLLPKDLTPREAAVLGAWLHDLSFDR